MNDATAKSAFVEKIKCRKPIKSSFTGIVQLMQGLGCGKVQLVHKSMKQWFVGFGISLFLLFFSGVENLYSNSFEACNQYCYRKADKTKAKCYDRSPKKPTFNKEQCVYKADDVGILCRENCRKKYRR